MKKIITAIALVFSLPAGIIPAQGSSEIRESIEVQIPVVYQYLVQLPTGYAEDTQRQWPLLLFLHGSGERGNDLDLVRKWGPPRIVTDGTDLPFVVISPQCPSSMGWIPEILLELLNKVESDYRIDPDRIVVTGLSMGGHGTWQLAAAAPERFAAIAPICGYANPAIAAKLADLPNWVFHGMLDEAVEIQKSTDIVNALNELEAPVRFTVYPDGDHGAAWKKAYNESGLLDWLLKARR